MWGLGEGTPPPFDAALSQNETKQAIRACRQHPMQRMEIVWIRFTGSFIPHESFRPIPWSRSGRTLAAVPAASPEPFRPSCTCQVAIFQVIQVKTKAPVGALFRLSFFTKRKSGQITYARVYVLLVHWWIGTQAKNTWSCVSRACLLLLAPKEKMAEGSKAVMLLRCNTHSIDLQVWRNDVARRDQIKMISAYGWQSKPPKKDTHGCFLLLSDLPYTE